MRIIIEFDNGATATHDLPVAPGAPEPPYQTAPGTSSLRAGATDAGAAAAMGAQPGATEPGTATTSGVHSTNAQSAGAAPQTQ